MAENSYSSSNASLGAVPRYDSSRPVYNNDAYTQVIGDDSAYSNQNRTGFRQAIPKALSNDYYDIPEYQINALDYTKPVVQKEIPKPVVLQEGGENDNGSSEASRDANLDMVDSYNSSINSEENNPTGGMTQANIDNPVANPTDFYGNPMAKEVHGPEFNPMTALSVLGGPLGFAAGIADTAYGQTQPGVPTSGYGTPGTYSSITGNKFDANSRAFSPITGQYKQEYGTKKAWSDKMKQDPFGNIFGDPDVAAQGKNTDMEHAGHTSEYSSLSQGKTDPMGNPSTVGLGYENRGLVAMQLGIDMGLPAHSVAPGTATNQAISTGKDVPGSQVSKGGKFSTQAELDAHNEAAADAAADAQQAADNAAANAAGQNNDSGNSSNSNNSGSTAGVDGPSGEGSEGGDSAGQGGEDVAHGGLIMGKGMPKRAIDKKPSYLAEGKYIGQPTGRQTIVGRDIYSSPITDWEMGNLVGSKNASEKGSTMEMDGQYGNIPSIHNGMEYDSKQLYQMMKDKEIPKPTTYYDDEKKAIINSIMRSRALDGQNVMGMEHTQRDPFEDIFRSTK